MLGCLEGGPVGGPGRDLDGDLAVDVLEEGSVDLFAGDLAGDLAVDWAGDLEAGTVDVAGTLEGDIDPRSYYTTPL